MAAHSTGQTSLQIGLYIRQNVVVFILGVGWKMFYHTTTRVVTVEDIEIL